MRKIAVSLTRAGAGKTGAAVNLAAGLGLAEDAIWLTFLEPRPAGAESREHSGREPAGAEPEPREGVNLTLALDGASAHPQLVPFDPLVTTVNCCQGDDPSPVGKGCRSGGSAPPGPLPGSGAGPQRRRGAVDLAARRGVAERR